jgi:hypothetical protein
MAFPFSLGVCFLTARGALRQQSEQFASPIPPSGLAKAPLEKMTFKVY